MGFATYQDWSKYSEEWENLGRNAIENACKHKTQDDRDLKDRETNMLYSGWCEECDFHEDSTYPMMNFKYPLKTEPSEEKILEIVKKTNCSVMYNNETDEHFLVLCGGGMDLSQDIALAYIIAEKWIPFDLIRRVCKQPELSISKEDFKRLKKEVIEQLKDYETNTKRLIEQWKEVEK